MRHTAPLFMLVLLAALACSSAETETEDVRAPVVLAPVTLRDFDDRIDGTGELVAPNQAHIAAEVTGRVTAIAAAEGTRVEAGDVVIEIDPERRKLELDDAAARMAEAEATLKDAVRDERRIRQLHERNVSSQQQLDQAQTQLALSRSRLAGARSNLGVAERALRDASVAAPFSGLIVSRSVSVGEFVKTGDPLFELVSLDPIEVEFHLAERDSSRVALGNSVEVSVAPYPGESFEARVTFISPTIDARTRTLRVKAELSNPDGRMRPGLFARVGLGVSRRTGIAMVPEEALLYRADGSVVFALVGDNRVERRQVVTGVHRQGEVEIVRGLERGEFVVSRGHADLIDGSVVTARNTDGTPITPPVGGGPGSHDTEGATDAETP